jgi:hypothetical protein
MEYPDPNICFASYNLENIEPFTLIVVTDALTEWRWDGIELHKLQLDASLPHCWSSATLYDAHQQAIRRQWFLKALEDGTIFNAETLMGWQASGGYGPKNTDIVLERADGIGTVSTTVVSSLENILEMAYEDYLSPVPQVVSLTAASTIHEEKEFVQKTC